MITEKKTDLRVIKTKNLIKHTFFEMVQTIGYQRISVKELCEKALINRNTFYLHYKDKDDLIRELINEVFEKYQENLKPLGDRFYLAILKNSKDYFKECVKDFLLIINEDIELYRILLMDNYLGEYFKTFEKAYEKLILGKIIIKNKRSKQIFKYFIGGTSGVLVDWIVMDTTSLEDTADILAFLIYDNVKLFIKSNKKTANV